MSETLEIVVVRHGESKANAEARMQGRFDSPLNDRGRAQAHVVGRWFASQGILWDVAFCSPLLRASETAQIISHAACGSPPRVDPDLAEVAAGKLEGLNAEQIAQRFPSYPARKLEELGDFAEYGGESYADIQARAERVISRVSALSGRVLLVAHGGFNFHLVKRLICLPVPRVCVLRMDNCSATMLRLRERRGMRIGEVVWHVPLELMGSPVESRPAPAPAPGSALP